VRLVRCPTKCIAKLARGEAKRVPAKSVSYLAGYYIGCPFCGLPQTIRSCDAAFIESGLDVEEDIVMNMSPVCCTRCDGIYRIEQDEIVVVLSIVGLDHAR
jgi:hypothetical protein